MRWRELFTEDGKPYYWNQVTNETAWERPEELQSPKAKMFQDAPLPIVLKKCLDGLEAALLEFELFKCVCDKAKVTELQTKFWSGEEPSLDRYDTAVIAGVVKAYFRDMPDGLLATHVFADFLLATLPCEHPLIKEKLLTIAPNHFNILKCLLKFLCRVAANCQFNNQDSAALAYVFGPALLRISSLSLEPKDVSKASKIANFIVESLLDHYSYYFEDGQLVIVVRPKPPAPVLDLYKPVHRERTVSLLERPTFIPRPPPIPTHLLCEPSLREAQPLRSKAPPRNRYGSMESTMGRSTALLLAELDGCVPPPTASHEKVAASSAPVAPSLFSPSAVTTDNFRVDHSLSFHIDPNNGRKYTHTFDAALGQYVSKYVDEEEPEVRPRVPARMPTKLTAPATAAPLMPSPAAQAPTATAPLSPATTAAPAVPPPNAPLTQAPTPPALVPPAAAAPPTPAAATLTTPAAQAPTASASAPATVCASAAAAVSPLASAAPSRPASVRPGQFAGLAGSGLMVDSSAVAAAAAIRAAKMRAQAEREGTPSSCHSTADDTDDGGDDQVMPLAPLRRELTAPAIRVTAPLPPPPTQMRKQSQVLQLDLMAALKKRQCGL